jgi:hypothetical protein
MRVTNLRDGTARVFRTEAYKGEPPAAQIRVMDCMDCHNRPAHVFPTANDVVERAMASGAIATTLPNIKREAVKAMQQKITTSEEAPQKIADYLRGKYKDAPGLPATIEAVATLYSTTLFPERKADWQVYPNNIGHKDWLGCFRCHDDKHTSDTGKPVKSSDCTSCHTLLSQGSGAALESLSAKGLEFKHPGSTPDPELTCSDCHNGGIQK